METIFERLRRNGKNKGIKFNELLLKKYYSCIPLPISKLSNISLMGRKRFPYFKLYYHWDEGDSCLISFNAKKFCTTVILGYLDVLGLYSLMKIDINLLGKFLLDSDFRQAYKDENTSKVIVFNDLNWLG